MAEFKRDEMLSAFITLSEGEPISAEREGHLIEQGAAFVARARIGYVVIDRERASPSLRRFAVRALHLRQVDSDGPLDLYVPAVL
jgi:hypothetical protein